MGVEFLHADGRRDEQRDVTKLVIAVRNSSNASKTKNIFIWPEAFKLGTGILKFVSPRTTIENLQVDCNTFLTFVRNLVFMGP